MILGEIDLSIGGTYLFAPILFYKIATAGLPLVPGVLARAGGVHGGRPDQRVFRRGRRHQLVRDTLGMLFALEGLTLIISHGRPWRRRARRCTRPPTRSRTWSTACTSSYRKRSTTSATFAKVFGGGTYSELIWALLIVIVLQTVLTFTRWGLYTVAVGSNKLGAAEAGVRVRLVTIRNFVLCALTGGLVGIFEAVRSAHRPAGHGGGERNPVLGIAAAVIGGTLLAGGSGTVVGALIGALFLGILKDGLTLQGVNANYLLFYRAWRSSWR